LPENAQKFQRHDKYQKGISQAYPKDCVRVIKLREEEMAKENRDIEKKQNELIAESGHSDQFLLLIFFN
jgi:hypothetical protein